MSQAIHTQPARCRELQNDYTDNEPARILDFTRKNERVLPEQLASLREMVSER